MRQSKGKELSGVQNIRKEVEKPGQSIGLPELLGEENFSTTSDYMWLTSSTERH